MGERDITIGVAAPSCIFCQIAASSSTTTLLLSSSSHLLLTPSSPLKTIISRKGDYYRYLAEFKSGQEKKEAADLSLKAYELCFLMEYRYVGFYKGVQSAGGAVAWQVDAHKVPFLNQLLVNWSLTTRSYPLLVLLVILAVKDESPETTDEGPTKEVVVIPVPISADDNTNVVVSKAT